ncbi:MAG: DcaP family trimeric outer membrane transporter [Lutimonas sp.]
MRKKLSILILVLLASFLSVAQVTDTTTTKTTSNRSAKQFERDTLETQKVSPLDIADDRGIYILTKDGNMQLRILGSVRFALNDDFVILPVKKTFNTYFIPTGDNNIKVSNFNSSLGQTRLGFEVSRKLKTKNVFIRLETDFNGEDGAFRIRHAYGTIGKFLVGQTWSLFSNVSSLPAMVDGNGPTGSVTLRTPQVRFSGTNRKGTNWAVAMEYARPDLNTTDLDTTGLSVVQVIPDVTARIERQGIFGAVQLSTVITTLSIIDSNNDVTNTFGLGGQLSGTIDFTKQHQLLYQLTYGRSIAHFITTFSGTGRDFIYNPETGKFDGLNSFGGFVSYGFDWTKNLKTNLSAGYAELSNKEYQLGDTYKNSMSMSFDTFWSIVDGLKLGVEYVYGQRWNKDGSTGKASRISTLFYYDF